MRNLASKKYGLDMLEPHLPSATLEQVLGGREGWWAGGRAAGGWVGGQAGIMHTYVNWGGLQERESRVLQRFIQDFFQTEGGPICRPHLPGNSTC